MATFDVMGPVMIGPSTSHTAGAAKIGYLARQVRGARFEQAVDIATRFKRDRAGR